MPQYAGDDAVGKRSNRHNRVSSKVVPAIPLPLSKPRPARPQPKAEISTTTAKAASPPETVFANGEKEVFRVADTVETSQPQQNGQARAGVNGEETGGQDGLIVETPPAIPLARSTEPNGRLSELDGVNSEVPNVRSPIDLDSARSSTVTSSPNTARRPVERMDMRSMRAELPPAFIPLSEHGIQASRPAMASEAHAQPPVLPHAHPRHPSANNIIFGQRDSSNASPAPLSAGSNFAPPLQPGQAPFPGHDHHASEHYPSRIPSQAHPQAQSNWLGRPATQANAPSHYHPHAHMPFRHHPREQYTPNGTSVLNGNGARSRSGSQASSAAYGAGGELQSPVGLDRGFDGARTGFAEHNMIFNSQPRHMPTFSQQMQMTPPPFTHPEFASGLENAESLRDHILSQFRRPDLSDCHLHIVEADGLGRQHFEGHRVVLTRSPTLTSLIRRSESPIGTSLRIQVQVSLQGRYVRVGPFLEAVRYLYGGSLPSPDTYGPSFAQLGYEERMEVALQHIATGAWLNIASIAGRGVEMAGSLLNWESLPSALAFALDGGIGQLWPIDDGSEEMISNCSSDDSFNKPEAGGSPTYDPYSTGLLHRLIDFIVQNLPPNFYLDPIAPQLAACPRLPTAPSHESKSSRSDPRLSKIRFGEFDDQRRPSVLTTSMSSIFLSLPFPLLKYLLEHPVLSNRLGPETVSSIMRQVVNEREARRQRALKGRNITRDEDGMDRTLIQNMYWEEGVEQSTQHKAGFRLARRRRGIDTPPSSGAESEQRK